MRNGTVQIAQHLTSDHAQAANALRLPLGSSGAYGSPYLSVTDLMKRWPESSNRREVLMITDGIDRFRGRLPHRGLGFISPDVDSASVVAQRTGTMIHTIYARGVGRRANNFWEITNGQNSLAKLSDETGGESFFLGTHTPVSFRPYLDSLQRSFDNRYVLEFNAVPGKKAGLQYVKLTTEVAGVETHSAGQRLGKRAVIVTSWAFRGAQPCSSWKGPNSLVAPASVPNICFSVKTTPASTPAPPIGIVRSTIPAILTVRHF